VACRSLLAGSFTVKTNGCWLDGDEEGCRETFAKGTGWEPLTFLRALDMLTGMSVAVS
jgi:hypothetical protein